MINSTAAVRHPHRRFAVTREVIARRAIDRRAFRSTRANDTFLTFHSDAEIARWVLSKNEDRFRAAEKLAREKRGRLATSAGHIRRDRKILAAKLEAFRDQVACASTPDEASQALRMVKIYEDSIRHLDEGIARGNAAVREIENERARRSLNYERLRRRYAYGLSAPRAIRSNRHARARVAVRTVRTTGSRRVARGAAKSLADPEPARPGDRVLRLGRAS